MRTACRVSISSESSIITCAFLIFQVFRHYAAVPTPVFLNTEYASGDGSNRENTLLYGSSKMASVPYSCFVGGHTNLTPRASSVLYIVQQSSVLNTPCITLFLSLNNSRTFSSPCSAISSWVSAISGLRCPCGPTVSQRIPGAYVTSARFSKPSFSV